MTAVKSPWQLRDAAVLLRAVRRRRPWQVGDTLFCVVDDASTRQRLRGCAALPSGHLCELPRRDALQRAAVDVGLARWPATQSAVLPTVVFVTVRRGRCVPAAGDFAWPFAWRYVNGFDAFTGDVLLVTEHGWRSDLDGAAGATPRLRRE